VTDLLGVDRQKQQAEHAAPLAHAQAWTALYWLFDEQPCEVPPLWMHC